MKLGDAGSVQDVILSCAQLKLLHWLAHRGPKKGITFNAVQTTIWRRRPYRTRVPMVNIDGICLPIRTQNGYEICGIKMLHLSHSKLLLNVTCGVKIFIFYIC